MNKKQTEPGTLFVVATPIGNLEDITLRALRILENVEYVASEDTRVTGKLLSLLKIKNNQKLISCFDGNEAKRAVEIADLLESGKNVALVSDAGTPAISDPGKRVVKEARKRSLNIVPVPGVSAAIALYSVAGLDSDQFRFEGFLPLKKNRRKDRLTYIKNSEEPTILYEAPHRLIKTLKDLSEIFGEKSEIIVVKELTKLHEKFLKSTIGEMLVYFEKNAPQGEFSLIINLESDRSPFESAKTTNSVNDEVKRLLSMNLSPKIISSILVNFYNISKRDIYQLSIEYLKKNGE